MSTLEDGQNVGRYRVLRFLGAGAMGEVYLAEDPHIERKLAIKTVRLAGGRPQDVEDRKRRLLREARAAGRMLHPHIVTLFDAGEFEGLLYLAFEFVEGADLAGRIETPPPLTLGEVLRIIAQVADALEYAHRQGIVHRDIKPSNILLDTAGRVKVADFGIAKVVGQNTELTVAGSVMGSPQYLSPEQIRGEELDGRSDIFSLGVVLYELLSGRRPFDGETITTLVYQILNKDPSVSSLRSVPPRLDQLLHHMMAKDREQRIANAAMVAEELAAIARELPEAVLAAPAAEAPVEMDATRILPSRASAVPSGVMPPATPPSGAVATGPAAPARTSTGSAAPQSTGAVAPLPPAPPGAATWVPPVPPPPAPPVPSGAAPGPTMAPPPTTQRSKVPWLALVAILILVVVAVGAGAYWAYTRYIQPMMASRLAASSGAATADASGPSGPSAGSGGAASSPVPSGVEPPPIPMGVQSSPPASSSSTSPSPSGAPSSSASTLAPVPAAPSAQPAEPPPIQSSVPTPSTPAGRPRSVPSDTPTQPSSGRGNGSSGVRTSPQGSGASPSSQHAPSTYSPERPAETPALPLPTPSQDRQSAASEPGAEKVVHSGLEVSFKVTPADSYVLVDGTLIGRAEEWNGEKEHRSYSLPGAGSYAIKIKHSGMEDMRVMVEASATRGVTPITASLKPLPAENVDVGDLKTVRVRQGISLHVEPDSAQVQVDGQQRGIARQYPGHFGRSSEMLLLEPGRHRVTLTLPGYRRYDFAVEVYAGAERDHEEVKVVLTRGASS